MTKIDEAIRKLRKAAEHAAVAKAAPAAAPAAIRSEVDILRGEESAFIPRTTVTVPLDADRLEQLGYSVPEEDRALLTDQYRVIKRPLISQAFGRNSVKTDCGNLVQITSSLPGEGKTFTCLNLAISIGQEQNQTVLLVDADVLNPKLSQLFGLEQSRGLLDYLEDPTIHAETVAYRTNLPGLTVIPAGVPRQNAAELLSSARMVAFVNEVARQRPHLMVLLDSPPVAPTSEARILAESAGQIVIVVAAGKTAQDTVREAAQALPPEKPVTFILNRVAHRSIQGTYGYGYGYRKGGASSTAVDAGRPKE